MVGWEKSVSRENTEDRMLELLTKRRLLPTASRAMLGTGSLSFLEDPARAGVPEQWRTAPAVCWVLLLSLIQLAVRWTWSGFLKNGGLGENTGLGKVGELEK